MDDREIEDELQALRDELIIQKAITGIMLGALRFAGVIGGDEEYDIGAAIRQAALFAPTVASRDWERASQIIGEFANAVTLDRGRIMLRPDCVGGTGRRARRLPRKTLPKSDGSD
jgi:hypothetical protein